MDQLEAIGLFQRVVETGSFTEAARQTNTSTSSVSRRIAELEEWVGAALLHRTTRKVGMTEAGHRFHQHTLNLLSDLDEARLVASQREDEPAGEVRVSMPASLEQHIVVAASLFQARWPEVQFGLTSTDRNVDLVSEGFDLAIRAGELADSTLRARRLCDVPRRLCASPAYLAGAAELNHPADVQHHDCLVLGRVRRNTAWSFSGEDSPIVVEAAPSFVANSGNMLVHAARHGRGLMLAPEWIVGPYLANGELVEALPGYRPEPAISSLYAVHAYKRFVPPKVALFIEFLADRFSRGYDWLVSPTDLSVS